jgi:twitching motility protein PilT
MVVDVVDLTCMDKANTQFDARAFLEAMLAQCVLEGASDVHLTAGEQPHLRLHGELKPRDGAKLTALQTEALAAELITSAGLSKEAFDARLNLKGAVDGAVSAPDGTRFRFNIFRKQRQFALVLRRLEDHFRSLAELGLPESLYALCDLPDGLVIVSGPTGAGKSNAGDDDRSNQRPALLSHRHHRRSDRIRPQIADEPDKPATGRHGRAVL